MQIQSYATVTNSNIVIVGGGISGFLLALRLSRDQKKLEKGIVLIEKQPQLGGRFFFSSSSHFYGKSHKEISKEIFEDSSHKLNLSGPGFETMEPDSLEALFRHIESNLTEDEKNELDEYFKNENDIEIKNKNNCFFVKKEFVSETELLSGSSEILTKKESEALKAFVYDFYQPKNYGEIDSVQLNESITFEKAPQWVNLSKATKETLSPILTSIVGPNWDKSLFQNVCKSLWCFFSLKKKSIPHFFYRKMCIEFAIENILRKRGVQIRTLCEVLRVNHSYDKKFQLFLSDEVNPSNKNLNCENLIFAIPLVKCLGILAKEHFSASQSRFVSKVRPVSLVVSELSNFFSKKSQDWPENVGAGDRLVFAVERAQGFITNDERMILSTRLDYEESMQAPSVREAVSRLRRAAARVLKAEYADELKKGARIPQNKISERIVLLPVAYTIPCDMSLNIEVKETKMGIEGLYCCGDSFPGFADEPWKMVVSSVYDVVTQLN
jgi:predicted NAD/FAD-dependent oxidoreductase